MVHAIKLEMFDNVSLAGIKCTNDPKYKSVRIRDGVGMSD